MEKKYIAFIVLLFINLTHVWANNSEIQSNPLSKSFFIPNGGQWNEKCLFYLSSNNGQNLWIEKNAFNYEFFDASEVWKHGEHHDDLSKNTFVEAPKVYHHNVRLEFIGANLTSKPIGIDSTNELKNYYHNNVRATGLNSYKKLKWINIYTGIDLILYTSTQGIKYDFIVSPHADVNQIKLKYDGALNQEVLSKSIQLKTSLGDIIEKDPISFYENDSQSIETHFNLKDSIIQFHFPNGYDTSKTMRIDPDVIFSRSVGAVSDNFGMTASFDSEGHLYAAGVVFYSDFPITIGAYQTTHNNRFDSFGEAFIVKFSPDGAERIYSTFLGGSGHETVHSLIVNEQDELFAFGVTSSQDFPITSAAFQPSHNGGSSVQFLSTGANFPGGTDLYISKFSKDGTALLASTYLGGTENDGINHNRQVNYGLGRIGSPEDSLQYNYGDVFRGEIITDKSGNCYVATVTRSTDFPTINSFQNSSGGHADAVVFKFNEDLSQLEWSTYLGGSNREAAYSLKLGLDSLLYVTGGTSSSDFPQTGNSDLSSTYNGGIADAFITCINLKNNSIKSSQFFGTSEYDQAYFIETDITGDVYIIGQSLGNIPITSGKYGNLNSPQFIAKFNKDISQTLWTTTFGNGDPTEVNFSPTAFLVDECGNIYVSGWTGNVYGTNSVTDLPVTNDAPFQIAPDGNDFYFFVLESDATKLLHATYFGGNQSNEHVDGGTSRFSKNGTIYQSVCANCGGNRDFPVLPTNLNSTENLYSRSFNCNLGVLKIGFDIYPEARISVLSTSTRICKNESVSLINVSAGKNKFQWSLPNGTTSKAFQIDPVFPNAGLYDISLSIEDTTCLIKDTATIQIEVLDLKISHLPDTSICGVQTLSFDASTQGTASTINWSNSANFSPILSSTDVLNTVFDRTQRIYFEASNQACDTSFSFLVRVDTTTLFGTTSISDSTLCIGQELMINAQINNADTKEWILNNTVVSTQLQDQLVITKLGKDTIEFTAEYIPCQLSKTWKKSFEVFDSVSIQLPTDTLLCFPQQLQLSPTVSNNSTFHIWSVNRFFTPILYQTQSINHFVDSPHSLYYRSGNLGCINEKSIQINFSNMDINVTIENDSLLCENDSIIPKITVNNATDWYWIYQNQINSSITPIRFTTQHIGREYLYINSINSICETTERDSFPLIVSPKIDVQLPIDTTICETQTANLNIQNNSTNTYNYQWSFDPNFTSIESQQTNLSFKPITNKKVYLNIYNQGCTVLDSLAVTLDQTKINSNFTLNNSYCETELITPQLTLNGASNWQWYLNNKALTSNSTPSFQSNTIGLNTLELRSSYKRCALYDTIVKDFNIDQNFLISIVPDQEYYCKTTPLNFLINSTQPYQSIKWSFSPNYKDVFNNTASYNWNYDNDTTFYIKAENGSCIQKLNKEVKYIDNQLIALPDLRKCSDDYFRIELQNTIPNVNYSFIEWTPVDQLISRNDQINPVFQAKYNETFQVKLATTIDPDCYFTRSFNLQVDVIDTNLLSISFGENPILQGQKTDISLSPTHFDSIQWSPSSLIEDDKVFSSYSKTTFSTQYTASIYNGVCRRIISDSLIVKQFSCKNAHIYIPNAFTPNSDDLNDFFELKSVVVNNYDLSIYNKWGEEIKTFNESERGWDGTHDGIKVPADVYFYKAKGKCINKEYFNISGTVYVVR